MNPKAIDYCRDKIVEMVKLFSQLTGNRRALQVWNDFLVLGACSLSPLKRSECRPEFLRIAGQYTMDELTTMLEMLEITAGVLNSYPECDFLGEFCTSINLTKPRKIQSFSSNIFSRLKESLANETWVLLNDATCGSGSTIIQLLDECRCEKINYQSSLFVIAKDPNRALALASYVQLSLLGCAGCVIVPDALGLPHTTDTMAISTHEGYEIWMLPMTFVGDWLWRIISTAEGKVSEVRK